MKQGNGKVDLMNINGLVAVGLSIALAYMLRQSWLMLIERLSKKDLRLHGKEIYEQYYGTILEKIIIWG